MARRGFGGTALRAALGAVTGVAEGLQQRDLLAAQKKREDEATRQAQQMSIANLMLQGFEAPAVTMERQQGARQAAGSAIASALQAASGQTPTPITGDFKALSQGYAAARPDRTVTIGGQQLALRETAPEREQRLSQTKTMQESQQLENAIAQLPAELQPIARASKVIPANLLQPRQEGMTEYQREMIRLRRAELQSKGQGGPAKAEPMHVPASDRRSMTELASSIKELDKALEATDKVPNAFGMKTMLPNVMLTRQGGAETSARVKARADVTGAIVKLRRTEFGTAMSKQEKESGLPLFPAIGGLSGGDDAKAIKEKLTTLKEKAMLELNTKREFYGMPPYDASVGAVSAVPAPAETPTASPAKVPAQAQMFGQWMDANPQRKGETDAQYEARYNASAKGGR